MDKVKILFVEDEPSLQKTLTIALEGVGYEVYSAYDGESGLKKAEELNPDLILLDLILPIKDGFMVLQELKNNENVKNIPVIVFTNLESVEDVEKVIELGATTYLVKADYEAGDIIKKIKEIIDKK